MATETAKREYTEDQRRVVEAYRALIESKGWTLRDAARPLQIAASTLSQVLSGSYKGDVGKIASRMSRRLHRARRQASSPERPSFRLTDPAVLVLDTCREAHALDLAALVTGPSGSGKSITLQEYCRQEPETILVTAGPYARPKALLQEIATQMGVDCGGGIQEMRQRIEAELQGSDRLIIVDEIDYAPEFVLQTLRILADQSRNGIVYCGTRTFLERMRRRRSGTIEQFLNRLARVVDTGDLTEDDLELLMEGLPLDAGAKKAAVEGSLKCGRRLVNGVLLALRNADGKTVGEPGVRAAFRRLLAVAV